MIPGAAASECVMCGYQLVLRADGNWLHAGGVYWCPGKTSSVATRIDDAELDSWDDGDETVVLVDWEEQ